MRLLVSATVVALIALTAACTQAPSTGWHKPGADQPTTAGDISACRERAKIEAIQRYPSRGGLGGAGGVTIQQQIDDSDRVTWEAGRLNACMRQRGYSLGP
jgi:hypothetical protein